MPLVAILEPMRPKTLDHVALWVTERDALADALAAGFGMHVIERTDAFTLMGAHARRFKLTLFEAEGLREPGALKHVALRVNSLPDGPRESTLPNGLVVRLVEGATAVDYDLDHVALLSPDPEAAATGWEAFGFTRVGATRLEVGGAFLELHAGEPSGGEPLLNHLAVLVDSVDEHLEEAREQGIEVADIVDAANTLALFVYGPDRVKLELVEHKPSFSLT